MGLNPERYDVHGYALAAGVFTALAIGATCGWYRSTALDNLWQRGVIAVLAAVGALLAGFIAAPIDHFYGVIGMTVWLLLDIALGILATRWAMNAKTETPPETPQ